MSTTGTAPSTEQAQQQPSVAAPKPERPLGAGRLPSLNQLAARINSSSNNSAASSTGSSSRPRLDPSLLLRTGSSASVSTTTSSATAASAADSTAVQAPSTRSTSPNAIAISPPQSTTPVPPGSGGLDAGGDRQVDPLTFETLEKLDRQEGATPVLDASASSNGGNVRKTRVGYKNIPSLDAITARLVKARTLSIDGSAKPPEPEMVEDPKTPGVLAKPTEHPLQFSWTIYHDSKANLPFTPATATSGPPSAYPPPESGDYEAGLTIIGEFDTVESFCRYFNWLKPPSKLERNSNYHLFKSGIKPMWEDPANANGGKWVLTMKNNPQLLDRCWSWLAMALVGEELEEGDDICGAVVSLRTKVDRIQVWTRSKDDVEKLNAIGKRLVKLLDISEADGIGLEFTYNTDDRPLPNKFLSIQALPQTSFRSSFHAGKSDPRYANSPVAPQGEREAPAGTPISPAGNGTAFGSFSANGIGRGGAAWRASHGK